MYAQVLPKCHDPRRMLENAPFSLDQGVMSEKDWRG